MNKPRLLDLFCGAGGCAVGYARAGFEVVGVDLAPQPHYPFEFHQADALTFSLDGFDAIHASPPCQHYTALRTLHRDRTYPDLVAPIRERLAASGLPYIIENVPGAPLPNAVMLCGSMFGLRVKRHRLFESNELLFSAGPCGSHKDYVTVVGHDVRPLCPGRGKSPPQGSLPISVGRAAMDIEWMNRNELAQAIPPAYTEWLGRQLLAIVERSAA